MNDNEDSRLIAEMRETYSKGSIAYRTADRLEAVTAERDALREVMTRVLDALRRYDRTILAIIVQLERAFNAEREREGG